MIFVTGGTGLVGSHLLFDLLSSGEKVKALKRPQSDILNVRKVFGYYSANAEMLFNKIEWCEGDLTDYDSLLDALDGIDKVYHCAAAVSFNACDKALLFSSNVEGTANMVNAALECKIKKLCYVSSVATLGKNDKFITEETDWKSSPENSAYSVSKYAAEREVWRASEEGLNVIVVNPSTIIGPGNWNNGSSALFKKAFDGISYYTDGVTGFIGVRDVCKLMIELTNSNYKNERFILNSENISYKEFFTYVNRCFGHSAPFIKITVFLSAIIWRIEKLKGFVSNKNRLITRETASLANKKSHYSNSKVTNLLTFQFTPIQSVIKEVCSIYLRTI